MVQSSRLHLDPTCDTSLDTLKDPDCSANAAGSPKPNQSTNPSVTPAAATGGVSGVEIIGIIVGIVIIALLAIMIVLLIVVILKKYKLTFSKRYASRCNYSYKAAWIGYMMMLHRNQIILINCIHNSKFN